MSERRYTLGEITGAMGDAMKALQQRGEVFDGRLMRLFVDDAVTRLKGAPEAPAAGQWSVTEGFKLPASTWSDAGKLHEFFGGAPREND